MNKTNLKSVMLHNHPPYHPRRRFEDELIYFLAGCINYKFCQKAIFDLSNAQRFKPRDLSHQNWGWYHTNVTHLRGQIMRESTFCQVSRQNSDDKHTPFGTILLDWGRRLCS
jgi:hypothetical protein